MKVALCNREVIQAAFVGIMRRVENHAKQNKPTYGLNRGLSEWGIDIEGALSEMAAAKALGVFWEGANRVGKDCDIAGYHVRSTHYSNGSLIVHPEDPNDARFLLITGKHGDYQLRGWILGEDAKKEKWWRDPTDGRPAFFVPQASLRAL